MKKILTLLMLFFTVNLFSQDDVYVSKMEEALKEFDSATTIEKCQASLNAFQRISSAKPDEWLPYYYMSVCNMMMGLYSEKKKTQEMYYEQALLLIEKIEEMDHDESEVKVVKANILMMMISVKPSKGGKLGPEAGILIEEAKEANPDNPRVYLAEGENLYYTPKMFGGDKVKACQIFQTAKEKCQTFEPASSIHPNWGEERIDQLQLECITGGSGPE
jgi:tetratricopeptide (TPR) repeat protein